LSYKLSLNNGNGTVWHLNYTSSDQGYLTTSVDYGRINPIPFGITVQPRLGSNGAELAMDSRPSGLRTFTEFSIDQQQRLTINGGLDDTKSFNPPNWFGALSRWYTCKGLGYPIGEIDVLVWVLGKEKPHNPTCAPADLRAVPLSPPKSSSAKMY
jgi:hypothetical protein